MKFMRWIKSALYIVVAIGFSIANAGSYEDFFAAAKLDDARTVQTLLARGFDPNARDEKGQVALYLALREGNFKVAEVLMAHPQLAVDASNNARETPLMMAALKGQTAWVRRLVERGAQVQQEGWSPLLYAATGPATDAVQLLLEKGAAIDAPSPRGDTPLMMAARFGAESSVGLLLARGADRSLRNDRQQTVVEVAKSAGRDFLLPQLTSGVK